MTKGKSAIERFKKKFSFNPNEMRLVRQILPVNATEFQGLLMRRKPNGKEQMPQAKQPFRPM